MVTRLFLLLLYVLNVWTNLSRRSCLDEARDLMWNAGLNDSLFLVLTEEWKGTKLASESLMISLMIVLR